MEKKNLDVYVVSWGGVGTTAFLKFLNDCNMDVNTNNDIDIKGKNGSKYSSGIKHINSPNHRKLKEFKIKKAIFIYDDVINSILSLWKRNYQCDQVKKLTNNRNSIPEDWSLSDYIENDQDLFEFQQFYYNWVTTKKEYPCLFVKGQQLYKHRFHILKFLDIPISSKFIENHSRNSDWFHDIDNNIKNGLYNIYGGFNDYITSLPDVQLQDANSTELISNLSVSDTLSSRIKNPYIDE